MPGDEQQAYLMTDEQKREKLFELQDQYDSDLDRTLFQEYWADLR